MSFARDSGYQYPANIRRSVTMLWVFVLTLNVLEYLLAWARTVFAWLDSPLRLPDVTFLQPFQNVSSNLLTAHLGLLVALICARARVSCTARRHSEQRIADDHRARSEIGAV